MFWDFLVDLGKITIMTFLNIYYEGIYSLVSGIILFLIMTYTGHISGLLSRKKGYKRNLGFILGFFFSFIGLCVIYLIPKNNNFEFKNSLPKRILLGFMRFTLVLLLIFFLTMLDLYSGTTILSEWFMGFVPLYIWLLGGLLTVRGIEKF